MSSGQDAYKLAFQLSPVILTGGAANLIPGGMLPIISLTEAVGFTTGILSGGDLPDMDNFFAHFQPMPGASLIDNQVGTYPFANQQVAANAIITQPLSVSLRMICPVREPLGYASKLATMMALKATLSAHNNSGGTYTVATPSYFYTNCLMTGFKDVTSGESKQAQVTWQMDFVQPLLTLDQAAQAQNNLMSKISSGTAIDGVPTWSGLAPTVGLPPSLAAGSLIPAASGTSGSAVASPLGLSF